MKMGFTCWIQFLRHFQVLLKCSHVIFFITNTCFSKISPCVNSFLVQTGIVSTKWTRKNAVSLFSWSAIFNKILDHERTMLLRSSHRKHWKRHLHSSQRSVFNTILPCNCVPSLCHLFHLTINLDAHCELCIVIPDKCQGMLTYSVVLLSQTLPPQCKNVRNNLTTRLTVQIHWSTLICLSDYCCNVS